MAISYVASATGESTASNSSFVLNKPSGVQDGDLLVAVVAVYPGPSESAVTFTAPTGWTKVTQVDSVSARPSFPICLGIFKRSALAADGSTWTGSYSRSLAQPEVTLVTAYRGASDVGNYSTNSSGSTSSMGTNSVTNPSGGTSNWLVIAGTYTAGSDSNRITCSATSTSRANEWLIDGDFDTVEARLWDTNATIATGSHSRTISRSGGWDSACSCIMILEALDSTPITGDLSGTLPQPTSEGVGEVHNDATVDADVPLVSADMAGEGQPQPADGPIDATVPMVSFEGDGNTDVRGTLSASIIPSVSFAGETVPFGIRVIAVEAEDRTIAVPSRGVEG